MTERQKHRQSIVSKAIASIEESLESPEMATTVAGLVRLLQAEKEMGSDEPREARLRWIEPKPADSS